MSSHRKCHQPSPPLALRNGSTVLAAHQLFEDVLLCAAKGKGKGTGKGKTKTKTIEGVGGRGTTLVSNSARETRLLSCESCLAAAAAHTGRGVLRTMLLGLIRQVSPQQRVFSCTASRVSAVSAVSGSQARGAFSASQLVTSRSVYRNMVYGASRWSE